MGKAKILVADDVKQNAKLLRVILSASEYEVVEAYDGEEALEKAKTENPDLILLDVMMPKITGYEVCKKLRAEEKTSNLPIVMITALHEMDDRIKGIDAGADDFISKPFNKMELLARVKSLLRQKRTIAENNDALILNAILSLVTEGVVVTDRNWEITHMNQTAREILGIQETGEKAGDLLTHLSAMNPSTSIDTIKNTQEKTLDFLIHPPNNQQNNTVNVRVAKLPGGNDTVVGIACILRRNTEG
ncbi:MAG: response regulator [Candidatus Brocadiaceae bacterium]|nr:response regulator [Candidatus Brocadiaceae bacterium]